MKKRPSIFLLSSALVGTFFGLHQDLNLTIFLGLAILCLLFGAIFQTHRMRVLAFLALTIFLCAAAAKREKDRYDKEQALIPKEATIQGRVLDAWPKSGHEMQALVGWQSLIIKLNLSDAAGWGVKAGQLIAIKANLKALEPALAPQLFDAYSYGLSHHIHAQATIKDPALIVLSEGKAPWIDSLRLSLRAKLTHYLTPHQSSLLLALILGETGLFSREQREVYQTIGAQHLLAVSGLQISMLAWLALMLFIPLISSLLPARLSHRSFILATLFTIILIWFFVLLCHCPRSAIRAGLMCTIVLVPQVFGRKIDLFDALFISGFLSLLFDPLSIGDVGFLLSYAATFGLLCTHALGSFWHKKIQNQSQLGGLLFIWLISSLGAFFATLPITLMVFGTWAPASMLANWFLVPLAACLQIPAIIFGLLGALMNAAWMLQAAGWCAAMIELCAQVLSELFGGIATICGLSSLAILILSLGIFALFLSLLARQITALVLSSLLILLPCLSLIPRGDTLKISVIPVGQGDATVVQMPSGETMLIDAGGAVIGDYDPGREVVLPTLKRLGIKKLAILAISHPDPDHILGSFAILEEMPVQEIWHSGFKTDHPLTKRLLEVATKKNIIVKNTIDLLGIHHFGESNVAILAPNTHSSEPYFNQLKANDNSLVIRIEHKGHALLWPGDLEKKGEELLLKEPVTLAADIIKAPHHGSRTSSTVALIERVNPKYVIYSTGRNNRFSFPHSDIVERYQQRGIASFNTASDGEITITINDEGIDIAAFVSRCKKNESGSCPNKGQPYERST